MRRPPVTTGRMMLAVAIGALATAISRHVARTWGASEVMTLALIVLSISVPSALLWRGRQRGFWLGFCLFGWGYLALSLDWTAPSMGDFLPTTHMLDALFARFDSAAQTMSDSFDVAFLGRQRAANFRAGGHAVLSLVFAAIGGLGGGILCRPKRPTQPESVPPDGRLLRDTWMPKTGRIDR